MNKHKIIGMFTFLILLSLLIFFFNPFGETNADIPYTQEAIEQANKLKEKVEKSNLNDSMGKKLIEKGYAYNGLIILVYPDKVNLEVRINGKINEVNESEIQYIVKNILEEKDLNTDLFQIKIT
ncbi:hypothetical protein [Ornithinibacillus sp. 179-J 7C1 HS]|uniref:hypothetical protein n=1 Tax=Ornithinibacillus sp. 179-J 7C1 HS TaxID=3142384 RepID=UPI0039A10C0B